MDNDEFEEFEQRVDKLVNANENLGISLTVLADNIAKEMGYSVQFVKYILDSADIHYTDEKLLRHMVKFIAQKVPNKKFLCAENILSANDFKQIAPLCSDLKNDIAFSIRSDAEENSGQLAMQFPLLTRIAIVATYCASYNPQTSDRIFFFKGKDVLKRNRRIGSAAGRGTAREDNWHGSGPRPFDHQRAMFIFLFFCKQFDEQFLPEKDGLSAGDEIFLHSNANFESVFDFTCQITHLIEQRMLQVISASENLDLPKYRCLCSLNFVEQIARSISSDFNLKSFLLDFASENSSQFV